jgi:hypothetical protein
MTRGEIWWVDFGLAYGSMPQGRRPAIIVQNDNFNASLIYTKSGGLNLWKAKIRRQVLQLIFLLRVFGEFGHFVLCKNPGNQIFRPNLFLFEQIPEYKLILPTNTFEFPPVIRQEKYRLHFDISSLSPFSCV